MKFNAEFNKLIKTVGHRATFFSKNDFEHTHLCQHVLLYLDIYRMSLHKRFTQCAKLVDEKNNRLFCCVSVRDFESKILIKGVKMVL